LSPGPNWGVAVLKPPDLIETARGLTELSPRRPTQANLRRAASTAYYAVFHCLAGAAADLLVGRTRNTAWHQVYRTLGHGSTKSACQNRQAMLGFPEGIRQFAAAFVTLQAERHRADYALDGSPFYKSDVVAAIDTAKRVISQFERADIKARRSFAVHVLFRLRSP